AERPLLGAPGLERRERLAAAGVEVEDRVDKVLVGTSGSLARPEGLGVVAQRSQIDHAPTLVAVPRPRRDHLPRPRGRARRTVGRMAWQEWLSVVAVVLAVGALVLALRVQDRKSTRLNSSHVKISYAVFCLKKKT